MIQICEEKEYYIQIDYLYITFLQNNVNWVVTISEKINIFPIISDAVNVCAKELNFIIIIEKISKITCEIMKKQLLQRHYF